MAFAALNSDQVGGHGTKGDGVLTEAANDAGVSDGASSYGNGVVVITTTDEAIGDVPCSKVEGIVSFLPPTVAPTN